MMSMGPDYLCQHRFAIIVFSNPGMSLKAEEVENF